MLVITEMVAPQTAGKDLIALSAPAFRFAQQGLEEVRYVAHGEMNSDSDARAPH